MAQNKKSKKKRMTATGTRLRVIEGNKGRRKKRGRDRGRNEFERSRMERTVIIVTVLLLLLAVVLGTALYLKKQYHVEEVFVEGLNSNRYTKEEIAGIVMDGRLGDNSLYLSYKYRDKGIEGVPFIEKIDVKVIDPHTIKIVVYEKSVAGYVEYLDRCMYFDRNGIIVESSETRLPGVPQITGLSFNQVVLYEPLPVKSAEVFGSVLDITQVLSKYGLNADRIYFDKNLNMTLYFGNTRASLGSGGNVEEKIARLSQVLPANNGQAGVFRLENYKGSGDNVSFERDEEPKPVEETVEEGEEELDPDVEWVPEV